MTEFVAKFQVGDKVLIVESDNTRTGTIGKVVKVNTYESCQPDFDVQFDDGYMMWFTADDLEPAVDPRIANNQTVYATGAILSPSQLHCIPPVLGPSVIPTPDLDKLLESVRAKKPYDLTIVIGRFQPFHDGHKQLIEQAIKLGDKTAVFIGSVKQPRSIKNPFAMFERMEVIETVFPDVRTYALEDAQYDDEVWKRRFHAQVNYALEDIGFAWGHTKGVKVAIVSAEKSGDTWRRDFLPEYAHEVATITGEINATEIRDLMWDAGELFPRVAKLLPMPQVARDLVTGFIGTDDYNRLVDEKKMTKAYRDSWSGSPFPPVFVAVDNIVRWGDKMLLIRRAHHPGIGLVAMPGGYIEVDETIKESALRELREETGLDTTGLRLVKVDVYDRPGRSARGRMITHVHVWDVTTGDTEVAGGDDASHAYWEEIEKIPHMRAAFFSDHHDIICNTLGIYWE